MRSALLAAALWGSASAQLGMRTLDLQGAEGSPARVSLGVEKETASLGLDSQGVFTVEADGSAVMSITPLGTGRHPV